MAEIRRVRIEKLRTGVPGLDDITGGGLPQYSFNLLAGGPGTGKTTLVHQIMFANATTQSPTLYFTVIGEPTIKMLRYQQQMGFFDSRKIGDAVHYVNLAQELLDQGLGKVLERITERVEQTNPGVVIVDSFRTVVQSTLTSPHGQMDLQSFTQRLAMFMTTWQATTFLVGEYLECEMEGNPIFTVADGILWLSQSRERNSVVRRMQVLKMRGQEPQPGLHTFRITTNGIQIFPRIPARARVAERAAPRRRVSIGVSGLDEMMGGGVLAGDAILVGGPGGSGKTVLGTQFIDAGLKLGEPGVIAVFEEYPEEYLARAKEIGFDLESMIRQGQLKIIYLRPLDLSVDETLHEIQESVRLVGAKRVVIDSISGFELAVAPAFQEDFRESLYRLVGTLTGGGTTLLLTAEVAETYGEIRLSPQLISFLTDDVILQRYVELDGRLKKVVSIIKTRGSGHSEEIREYDITPHGLVVGETLTQYAGLISGMPRARPLAQRLFGAVLTAQEILALDALIIMGEGTIDALARATGLQEGVLDQSLGRLEALTYVLRTEVSGKAVYRLGPRAPKS